MPVIQLPNCEIRDRPSLQGRDLLLPLIYQSRFELELNLSDELLENLIEQGIYRTGRIPKIKKVTIIIEF